MANDGSLDKMFLGNNNPIEYQLMCTSLTGSCLIEYTVELVHLSLSCKWCHKVKILPLLWERAEEVLFFPLVDAEFLTLTSYKRCIQT